MDGAHQITALLIERETIDKDQFERLLAGESPETVFVEPEAGRRAGGGAGARSRARTRSRARSRFPARRCSRRPKGVAPHVRAALLLAVLFAAGCGGSTTTVTRSAMKTAPRRPWSRGPSRHPLAAGRVAQTHAARRRRPGPPTTRRCDRGSAMVLVNIRAVYRGRADRLLAAGGRDLGERTIDVLARILELPYTLYQGTYVWPFAYDKQEGELSAHERMLLGDLAGDFQPESGYLGWRAGIEPNGRWSFFIAGEEARPPSRPRLRPLHARAPPWEGEDHPPPAFDGTAKCARVCDGPGRFARDFVPISARDRFDSAPRRGRVGGEVSAADASAPAPSRRSPSEAGSRPLRRRLSRRVFPRRPSSPAWPSAGCCARSR